MAARALLLRAALEIMLLPEWLEMAILDLHLEIHHWHKPDSLYLLSRHLTQSHGAREAQSRFGHISEAARRDIRMRDGFEITFLSKNKKSDKGQN